MSWQPSFHGTVVSGGGHPPTVCPGHNLAHLPGQQAGSGQHSEGNRIPHSKSKPSTHFSATVTLDTMNLLACTIAFLMTPFVVYGPGLITAIAGGGTFDFPASANGGRQVIIR